MLLNHTTVPIQKGNVQATSAFKISAGPHAFNLLLSGLYSNKIAAVLREIGCNAVDAHVMAGTPDLPIEVKLPTALDPHCHIKDWGPGLSEEFVMSTYVTIFESTKSQSNDAIGGFGLGCKSPYAYSDQFVVESAHNGVLSTFAAHRDSLGAPVISLLSRQPAAPDWPHGVKVSLPVKPTDFYEFQRTAQKVFQYFRIKPRILGDGPIKDIEYRHVRPDYAVPEDNSGTSKVVMGGVAYPFQFSEVWANSLPLEPHCDIYRNMSYYAWHFFLPIGAVAVTPSRESIDMTPSSRAVIQKAIKDAWQDLAGLITDELHKVDRTLDSYREAHDKTVGLVTRLLRTDTYSTTSPALMAYWRANPASLRGNNLLHKVWESLSAGMLHATACNALQQDTWPALRIWTYDNRRKQVRNMPASWTAVKLSYTHKSAFVVLDPKRAKHFKARLRQLLADETYDELLVVDGQSVHDLRQVYDFFGKLPVDFHEVTVAELPPLTQRTPSGTVRTPAKRVALADRRVRLWDVSSDSASVDPPTARLGDVPATSKVFVLRTSGWGKFTLHTGRNAIGQPSGMQLGKLSSLTRHLKSLGICPTHVAVITASEYDKLKFETTGWVSMDQWIQSKLNTLSLSVGTFVDQPASLTLLAAYRCALGELVWYAHRHPDTWASITSGALGRHPVVQEVDDIVALCRQTGDQSASGVQEALDFLTPRGFKTSATAPTKSLVTYCREVQDQKFPALTYLKRLDDLLGAKASAFEPLLTSLIPFPKTHIQAAA